MPADTRLASMATTMHWLPNFSAASRTKPGFCTAAVLIETLSAPASSRLRMSLSARTPPPTVSGMKQASAVRGHGVEQDSPRLVARGDVEKAEFVGAGSVIGLGGCDGVSGIHEVQELHAFHDAAVLDVEAGDEADLQHQAVSRRGARRSARA